LLAYRTLAHNCFARRSGTQAALRTMGRLSPVRPLDRRLLGITGIIAARRFRVIVIRCKFGPVRGMPANVLAGLIVGVMVGPIVRVVGMRRPVGRAIGGVVMRSFPVRAIGRRARLVVV
jgi:hypothetical protein